MAKRKSNLKFRVINPNTEEALVNKLIDIIVHNLELPSK